MVLGTIFDPIADARALDVVERMGPALPAALHTYAADPPVTSGTFTVADTFVDGSGKEPIKELELWTVTMGSEEYRRRAHKRISVGGRGELHTLNRHLRCIQESWNCHKRASARTDGRQNTSWPPPL